MAEVERLLEFQYHEEDDPDPNGFVWRPAYYHGIFADAELTQAGQIRPFAIMVIEDAVTGDVYKVEPNYTRFIDTPSFIEKLLELKKKEENEEE